MFSSHPFLVRFEVLFGSLSCRNNDDQRLRSNSLILGCVCLAPKYLHSFSIILRNFCFIFSKHRVSVLYPKGRLLYRLSKDILPERPAYPVRLFRGGFQPRAHFHSDPDDWCGLHHLHNLSFQCWAIFPLAGMSVTAPRALNILITLQWSQGHRALCRWSTHGCYILSNLRHSALPFLSHVYCDIHSGMKQQSECFSPSKLAE